MVRHIMLNGEILPADKPCLYGTNRGLLWHDAFTVQLRGNSCFVYDCNRYFNSIAKQAQEYSLSINKNFTAKIFANDISLLLKKNRIYKEFVATITLFRNSTTSQKLTNEKEFSVLISVESLDHEFYKLNKEGIFTSSFSLPENISLLTNSGFPVEFFCNQLIEAGRVDDIIFTSNDGKFIRSLYSDIFFITKDVLVLNTPITDNCVNSTLSMRIADIAKAKLKIKVSNEQLSISDLNYIDSFFLADPVNGIRWAVGLDKKRFAQSKIIPELAFELYNFFYKQIERLKTQA